jgi:hypothetical protein
MSQAMTKKERQKHALEIHKLDAQIIQKATLEQIRQLVKSKRAKPDEVLIEIRQIMMNYDSAIDASVVRYADRLNELTEQYKK